MCVQLFRRAIWQLIFYIKILQNIHALFLKNPTFNNYVKEIIIDVNKDLYIKMSTAVLFLNKEEMQVTYMSNNRSLTK